MSDSPHDNAPDDASVSSVGHFAGREEAITQLGAELSADSIATVRRMQVSGEPGVAGWVVIARQVEAIAKHGSLPPRSNLRETIKEGK